MIGFSHSNELHEGFTSNRPMPSHWSEPTSSVQDVCDEIDAIMKTEHEDVILLDHSLPAPSLDLDLDSLSEFLDNPSSSTSTSYTQPLSINETSTTSAYSSLGISPKFTSLSIHPNATFSFPSIPNQPSMPVQELNPSVLGTSYPFQLPNNLPSTSSDVKRFRSASMNDGNLTYMTQQNMAKLDPLRYRPTNYIPRIANENKRKSPTSSSADLLYPLLLAPRPPSHSFSAVGNPPPFRLKSNLSSSYDDNAGLHFPAQTLFSLNQFVNHEPTSPPAQKRHSLVGFSVEEIKDDPISPNTTIEPHSEGDFWSDIEQNSSDPMHENDFTSDEDNTRHSLTDSSHHNPNASTSSNSAIPFWQYNVQSKGPKTKRILYLKERDPHLHREFSDPVYQIKLTQSKGHVNLSKLRKGDGNDVTPNPMKLYQLGKQIRDLSSNPSSVYHGIYHSDSHSNSNDTAEVKKEKNKIASRACRLRKKAQHEANKLKLHGLNEEHRALIEIISSIKSLIVQRCQNYPLKSSPHSLSLEASLDQIVALKQTKPVAGNSDGYVQSVVEEMEQMYHSRQQQRVQQ